MAAAEKTADGVLSLATPYPGIESARSSHESNPISAVGRMSPLCGSMHVRSGFERGLNHAGRQFHPCAQLRGNGNGAPKGAHFNLNIIGLPKGKTMSQRSGNVICVPETGSTKVLLSEGPFAVLDKNGTDGSASFQLPNPDPENDAPPPTPPGRALSANPVARRRRPLAPPGADRRSVLQHLIHGSRATKRQIELYQRVARASLHLCRRQ